MNEIIRVEKNLLKKNQGILVSVIVVTFNSSKFILETLNSIKKQSYESLELIISDDCSTDETVDTCKKWICANKELFSSIKLVESEVNTGIPSNCNRGLLHANGEWIKYIAGDDILLEDCIAKNMDYITIHRDSKVVFSNCILFKTDNGFLDFLDKHPLQHQKLWFSKSAEDQYIRLLKSNFIWTTPSLFIKRNLLIEMKGFEEKYKLFEDYPMWIRLTRRGVTLKYFDQDTVLYRQSESITRNESVWKNQEYIRSVYKYFISEISHDLFKIDKTLFYRKKLHFFKYKVLINFFGNKKSFGARAFNKLINSVTKEPQL